MDSLRVDQDTLDNSFVVAKINQQQYKLFKDDIVKLEKIEGLEAGDKIGKSSL
jgi:ribosomal protein L21